MSWKLNKVVAVAADYGLTTCANFALTLVLWRLPMFRRPSHLPFSGYGIKVPKA
jgi:hypothetical protein